MVKKARPTITGRMADKKMDVSVTDNDKNMSVYVDGKASFANAKKLKGGKYNMTMKVTGNGKHTVKAVDSAGNVHKVTFTIR